MNEQPIMRPILIAIAAATLILLGLQSAADLSRPTGGSLSLAQQAAGTH
jgi:hypothetical protein